MLSSIELEYDDLRNRKGCELQVGECVILEGGVG